MDWKMSHKSSHLQNTTSSMNLKSTQVKRFLSDVPNSQWCGGGSTEGSGLSGDRCHSQRREG